MAYKKLIIENIIEGLRKELISAKVEIDEAKALLDSCYPPEDKKDKRRLKDRIASLRDERDAVVSRLKRIEYILEE